MKKRYILECKENMSKQLAALGFKYNPRTDPLPTLICVDISQRKSHCISIGGTSVMITTQKAAIIENILSEYYADAKATRASNRPRKIAGGYQVSETPFTDLQKELDKGMGSIGGAVVVVFAILLCAIGWLAKHYVEN